MAKLKPTSITLNVTESQLAILEEIHDCLAYFKEKMQRVLPQSFSKVGESYIHEMIELVENIEIEWQLWVLEDFKKEMNSTEFFKDIGIKRVNPWDLNE